MDFDKDNIPILKKGCKNIDHLPTQEEKRQNVKGTEIIEQERQDSKIHFKGLFDYNDADSDKESFRILRALKYIQIVGRSLLSQQSFLRAEEITVIVSALYELPNRIIDASLNPVVDHYDEVVASLQDYVKTALPNKEISNDELRDLINQTALYFTLDVMNDIAFNCTDQNTIRLLDDQSLKNTNYIIQNLLMSSHAGNTDAFISKAIEIGRNHHDNSFLMQLVRNIVWLFVICHPDIKHRQVDRLTSGVIFEAKTKKEIMATTTSLK